jgi:hypothetical protein
MSDNLFGVDGAEYLNDSVEEVAERAWYDGRQSPILIQEWTSKPIRLFARADSIIDRIAEYDLEEYLDEDGRVTEHIEKRAQDPEVIAAFDHALDLLLKDAGWRWADEHIATWTVTWDESDPPEFHYERKAR